MAIGKDAKGTAHEKLGNPELTEKISYIEAILLGQILELIALENMSRERFDNFYAATDYFKDLETEFNEKQRLLLKRYDLTENSIGVYSGISKHPKREEISAKILELKAAKAITVNFDKLRFVESENECYDLIVVGSKLNMGQYRLLKPYILKK